MAKDGDTGRTKRPAKKGDSGVTKKRDSGSLKKGDSVSARKSSARAPAAALPAAANVKAKRLFLYTTPFTIVVLLGIGGYLYSLPDAMPPTIHVLDYTQDVDHAKALYNQAKPLFSAGKEVDGEGGLPKLRDAQKLLQQANEIIDKVREACDTEPGVQKNSQGQIVNFPYDEIQQQINMLLVSCRKEIAVRS